MELNKRLPPGMADEAVARELQRVCGLILQLADKDIFPWLESRQTPSESEVYRAASIVADRHCGATADPMIRNAQEQRQLAAVRSWLEARGYALKAGSEARFSDLPPGAFAFHLNVPVRLPGGRKQINIPADVAVMPRRARKGQLPVLVEAKSAGDFTNTNKRRKEEAAKMTQLRANYGDRMLYALLLCGYFDSGYLGYEAAEGIDWVWEHRIDDLGKLGL